MNPLEQYNELILTRQRNPHPKSVKCHKHHIIPRCAGGPDEEWNIVRLTPREHFVAHSLLPFIYLEGEANEKLTQAWNRLRHLDDGTVLTADQYQAMCERWLEAQRKAGHNSKLSEDGRRRLSEFHRGRKYPKHTQEWKDRMKGRTPWNKGKHFTEESKRKMSEAKKGKHHTEETKRKMSEARKGRHLTEEHKQRLREYHTGLKMGPHSPEHKQKLSEAMKRRWAENPNWRKPRKSTSRKAV